MAYLWIPPPHIYGFSGCVRNFKEKRRLFDSTSLSRLIYCHDCVLDIMKYTCPECRQNERSKIHRDFLGPSIKIFIATKQRHYFANKGPSSQSYGFSSSHVWMWELDYKESWVWKYWCYWINSKVDLVLEKTLESPLCCSPWGRKELNMTEQLKWPELNWTLQISLFCTCHPNNLHLKWERR